MHVRSNESQENHSRPESLCPALRLLRRDFVTYEWHHFSAKRAKNYGGREEQNTATPSPRNKVYIQLICIHNYITASWIMLTVIICLNGWNTTFTVTFDAIILPHLSSCSENISICSCWLVLYERDFYKTGLTQRQNRNHRGNTLQIQKCSSCNDTYSKVHWLPAHYISDVYNNWSVRRANCGFMGGWNVFSGF